LFDESRTREGSTGIDCLSVSEFAIVDDLLKTENGTNLSLTPKVSERVELSELSGSEQFAVKVDEERKLSDAAILSVD
jgi:hypothetical protein